MNQYEGTFGTHKQSEMRTGRAQGGSLTTGDTANSVSLQVELGIAQEVTVQIDNSAPGSNITAFALATVEFTIDGTTTVRQFEVAAGASISGVAKAIRVRVVDATPASHAQKVKYGVTMSVATMPRATTAVPPVLTGLASTTVGDGAASGNVEVPDGADGVIVFAYSASALLLELTQATADGVTTVLQTTVTPGQVVPLIGGAGRVSVANNGSAAAQVSIVFTIDG